MLLRLLLALVAGVCLAAAAEPVGWTWVTPFCVAALMLVVHGLEPRRAWLPGLFFGIGYFFILLWWMRVIGVDAWLGLSALQAAFFAPLGAILALLRRARWWPLWSAVAWVAVETVRGSWPFSGLPWGRLSYAVADTVWAPGLPWFGFTGVSLLLAVTGTTLAWLVLARPRAVVAVLPVGALMLATLLPTWIAWDTRDSSTLTVAAVQGDVPGRGDDLVAVHREVTANHVRATEQLGLDVVTGKVEQPDLVVWPENSTAVDPFRDEDLDLAISRAVEAVDAPVLVGAMVDAESREQVLNQGIVWTPQVGPGDRYTKRNPVPFGEYIPWRDLIFQGNIGKLRQIGRDMLSGTRVTPLRVNGTRVADAICFDVAYDDGIHAQIRHGGELVTVQTSNAFFIRTHQIAQQFEITRLRALETGRPVVVAATNGVSGIIGSDGEVIAEARPQTTTTLVESVGLSTRITPSVRLGNWPGRLAVLLTVILCVRHGRRPSSMPYIHRARGSKGGSTE